MLPTSLNAASLASLPQLERERILESLTETEAGLLLRDWTFWARTAQLAPPGDWRTWLILAGRGFGKTRSGAEWVRDQVEHHGRRRVALVGPTAADARDVMVEGESGVLTIAPPWFRPFYEPSKRRLTWPNGAIATLYSADEPERLRGPQHDAAWCDEPASWRYPESWDMLLFGLRLGDDPRVVVTGTPKPTRLIKELVADPTTAVTRGSTYENRANLAQSFLARLRRKYEGTRLGLQEIYAEILEDLEGALWSMKLIEQKRLTRERYEKMVEMPDDGGTPEVQIERIVVAIDPAVTYGEDSDETGIAVCAIDSRRQFYVLHIDGYRLSPSGWAKTAADLYHEFSADRIIAEVNQGGDLVEATLRQVNRDLPIRKVHASKGKRTRAEPVAALYEQGRVHHVGSFARAETQMCSFPVDPDAGDDMVDALVYGLTDLAERDDLVEHGEKLW